MDDKKKAISALNIKFLMIEIAQEETDDAINKWRNGTIDSETCSYFIAQEEIARASL